MTRYDPFAYGNVKLDEKAAGGQASPEDLLFADAGPVKQAAPAAEASWGLLDEDVGSLLPGGAAASSAAASTAAAEFGADILGELGDAAPAASKPTPAARPRAAAPRPASGPMQRPSAPSSPTNGAVAGRPAPAASPAQAAPVAAGRAGVGPAPAKPAVAVVPRRGRPMTALMVPLVLCVGGGTAASWLLVMQQNPVMAGIAGLLTLVSATFAWLLLRG